MIGFWNEMRNMFIHPILSSIKMVWCRQGRHTMQKSGVDWDLTTHLSKSFFVVNAAVVVDDSVLLNSR